MIVEMVYLSISWMNAFPNKQGISTTMSPWTIVAVIASVGKSYATYQAGMAQKAYYDSQAEITKLQYNYYSKSYNLDILAGL